MKEKTKKYFKKTLTYTGIFAVGYGLGKLAGFSVNVSLENNVVDEEDVLGTHLPPIIRHYSEDRLTKDDTKELTGLLEEKINLLEGNLTQVEYYDRISEKIRGDVG